MRQHAGRTAPGKWRKRKLMFEVVHDTGHDCAFQIWAAYCEMVRSLENFPELATFNIPLLAQALGSPYRPTRFWSASRYDFKSARCR